METFNSGKKIPLVLLGPGRSPLDEFLSRVSDFSLLPQCDHFLLLEICTEEEKKYFTHLENFPIPKEQLLLLTKHEWIKNLRLDPKVGTVEFIAGESMESLRLRLQMAVEKQKHQILHSEIFLHRESGAVSNVTAEAWISCQSVAHLAHALSIAMNLGPELHRLAVRSALQKTSECPKRDFEPHWPIQELISHGAALANFHWKSAVKFRDAFRQQTQKISFRCRTDLRSSIEKCMEKAWREDEAA